MLEDLTPQVAQEAGLQRGDVIQEINYTSIANANEARRSVREAGKRINRHGEYLFVVSTAR